MHVKLQLQPYVQSLVATRENHRLSFKYFGPYQVFQKIGRVVYKLKLLESTTVHPIFHVSQLKQHVGTQPVSSNLPEATGHLQLPVQALDRRVIRRGGNPVQQVLVRWSQGDEAMSS